MRPPTTAWAGAPLVGTAADLYQEACVLSSWGLPVFPLARKVPRCKWKRFQRRRPGKRQLHRLFGLSDVDGIGAVPGPLGGGLAVRDFDDVGAYLRWAGRHPELAAAAPTVRTRRGFHIWVRITAPLYRRMDDGEFIGDGRHYVVAPPSRHPSGFVYGWTCVPPFNSAAFPTVDPEAVGLVPRVGTRTHMAQNLRISNFVLTDRTVPEPPCLTVWDAEDDDAVPAPVLEAVLRNLPCNIGERHHMIFRLARALKDVPAECGPPNWLDLAFRAWWRRAVDVIGTKNFRLSHSEFRLAWQNAAVPMSESVPLAAFRGAGKGGERTGGTTRAGVMRDRLTRLLAACCAMARVVNCGGEFHLSSRTAAKELAIPEATVRTLLARLVATGALEVVRPGEPSPVCRSKTTVYRITSRAALAVPNDSLMKLPNSLGPRPR